jgi:hypothetical protein
MPVPSARAATTLDALTTSDLAACAVWQLTLREKVVGPNQGHVRPRPELGRYDEWADTGIYAVRTSFQLACDDVLIGYSTPISEPTEPEEHRLGAPVAGRARRPLEQTDDGV